MTYLRVSTAAALRRRMDTKGRSADTHIPNFDFLGCFWSTRGSGCQRGTGKMVETVVEDDAGRNRLRDARRTIFEICLPPTMKGERSQNSLASTMPTTVLGHALHARDWRRCRECPWRDREGARSKSRNSGCVFDAESVDLAPVCRWVFAMNWTKKAGRGKRVHQFLNF